MLERYAKRYRRDLVESVVPFWLKHGLDRKHGGLFTCLERDGRVYDPKKYLWLQGRAVWMFSRLYNELEPRPEYRNAAASVLEFMRRFGRDREGRVYFSVTREGKPVFYQRKPYAAVFMMMGLLEYSKAAKDPRCLKEAVDLFWRIDEWIRTPALLGRPSLEGQPAVSSLADVMVLGCMALELIQVRDDPNYRRAIERAVRGALRHYRPDRRILIENVARNGTTDLRSWPEGRLFNPGHSIETAWFLLKMLRHVPNAAHRKVALDALEGSLEAGWDKKYGGLYYFMDIEGKPTLPLESSMKLWWPHAEAIYAVILAYAETRDPRWLKWLEKIDAYAYRHFVDSKHGEWFGYCDRRGELTHTLKGNHYKGPFHVPRGLLFSVQEIERMGARRSRR